MDDALTLSHNTERSRQSDAAFREYLQAHQLTILDVALAARVRLSSVWCIEQGIPIREEHARAVRAALYQLTGATFEDTIAVIPAEILLPEQGTKSLRQSRLKQF